MRLVALLAALVLAVPAAFAEKIRTNQAAKLYAHPGEQEKVIEKIKPGQAMTVLAKEGRWIKVRFHGRTGYVPRSKVDLPDDDELARNTRRRPFVDGRGTKRGFGGDAGPDDRIGADATGEGDEPAPRAKAKPKDDEEEDTPKKKPAKAAKKPKGGDEEDDEEDVTPGKKPKKDKDDVAVKDDDDDAGDKDTAKEDDRPRAHVTGKTKVLAERDPESEQQFVAKPNMVLYPGETKGKWTFVENDEGDSGWVMSSQLDVDGGGGGGGKRKREIDLRARLGVTLLNQAMRSSANVFPDHYDLGTSMATIALGGGVLVPYKKDYLVGGEIAYNLSGTLFGGLAPPPNMATAKSTGLTLHDLNVRGTFGFDLHKKNGLAVFARLGYRFESIQVGATVNPLLLPSEIFQGLGIGGALAVPRLSDKVGLKFSLDLATTALGGVKQTQGLEDGANPGAFAACIGAQFLYRWKKDMNLQGTYDLDYSAFSFGMAPMQSTRGHTATNINRTDIYHTVTFGIARPF